MYDEIWEQAPLRVGIDLDRDSFIAWGSRPGDPLNLLPDPINFELYGVSGDWTLAFEKTDGGVKIVSVEMSATVDDAIYIGGEGTSPPIDASTSYKASIYVRGLDGEPLIFWLRDDNGVDLGSTSFTGSDEWQRIEADVTSDGASQYIDFIVQKDSTAATGTLSVTGPMLIEEDTIPAWNPGTDISLMQDISDYASGVSWQLGMSGPDERVCRDGEATVTLDNEDRRFSPQNEDGELFGYLEAGIFMAIELQRVDGTWKRKWTGFVEEINPNPTNRDRMAEILGLQGFTYITERDTPAVQLFDSPTALEIIEILCDGYTPPDSIVWTLDISELGVQTVLWGPEGNIEGVDGETYTVLGEDWSTDDEMRRNRKYGAVRALLEQLVEAEQGLLWLDEDGVLHFRDLVSKALFHASPISISIDSDAASAEYEHGNKANIVNDVTVNYYPRAAVTGVLGFSADNFTVPGGGSVTKSIALEIDGKKFAAEQVTASLTYASGSPGTATVTATMESSNRVNLVLYAGGSDAEIERIDVIGTGYSSGPEGNANSYSLTSISKYRRKELKIDNRFIETEPAAQTLAERILTEKALPRGRITGVSIAANRSEEWYTRMVETAMMDGWLLSEYQTGLNDWPGIVFGQRFNWSPTLLQAQFVIGEGLANIYWVLDLSKLDESTVLL